MNTIIVATDFSKEAENAVEYAAAIAKTIQADIVLFNGYPIPVHASNARLSADRIQEMIDSNNEHLKERADDIKTRYGITVLYETAMLDVFEELTSLIQKYDARAVVMGTAAKSIEQDLLGNTTTFAISKVKIPVLAIPLGVTFSGIKKILFACDVLRGVHQRILERVKETASRFGAEVEVFYVSKVINEIIENEDGQSPSNAIDESLEGVTYYYKNVQSNAIIHAIEDEIKEIGADLLIMVPNKYGFWKSLIHRSKTRMMASRTEIPLLSINI
ncbi:Nucleotide-binding universal stress protein, UspA family [bacterium A37T11]|nr:Nucleotide-binding universal stress protein, UspA family [bacterium A37T11]